MHRAPARIAPVVAAAATLAVATAARAAESGDWPAILPGGWDGRGPGGGLAILPAAAWWLCTLGWMRTVEWVFRDATKHRLPPAFWCTVCGLPLFLAALLAWWIPSALAGLALMLVAWLAPVIAYAVVRNAKVTPGERVFTAAHARRVASDLLAPLGIEIASGLDTDDLIPKVTLAAVGGKDAAENAARLSAAAALPGFEEARKTLLAAVMARATTLVIDCDAAGMGVRHEVDGVWEKLRTRKPPRSRKEKEAWVEAPKSSLDVGRAVVAALKALVGLPTAATEAKSAPFLMQVDGTPRNCRLSIRSQGAGEQVVVQMEPPAAVFKTLADLGMSAAVAEKLVGLTAVEHGVILVSAPQASGLTTTFDIVVLSADRLLRDFISLEDAASPPREIQNVRPVPFDARTGVTPLAALEGVLRTYPNVIVTRDVRDKQLVGELVKFGGADKLVIMSLKAGDATEAIAKTLTCGVQPPALATSLLGSLCQRLVRKLCPKCREEYPPPAELLARLRLTPEQLPHLRRQSPQGCRLCGGTGYLGRTAIYELASGPTLRKTIAAGGDAAALRKAAMQDGMKPLRDAGLALAIAGVTSLEEIQRVFATPSAPPATATGKASG